jgi:hypothetical protein
MGSIFSKHPENDVMIEVYRPKAGSHLVTARRAAGKRI